MYSCLHNDIFARSEEIILNPIHIIILNVLNTLSMVNHMNNELKQIAIDTVKYTPSTQDAI